MDPVSLLELFSAVADAIRSELDALLDWGPADGHDSQYRHDVVADDIAVPMLLAAGIGVVSEESGIHEPERAIKAVLDPIDGSTNASIGLPWYATSICAVDADGPVAALVKNQALDVTYTATRGGGARRDGSRIAPTGRSELSDGIVVVNDLPPRLGARQFRIYGAAALDLCAVADGTFDGFVDCGTGLAPWDYLGGVLVCREAGAAVATLDGADLDQIDPGTRRHVVAGSTPKLRDQLSRAATR